MADAPDPVAVLASLGLSAADVPVPLGGGWDNHLWRYTASDGSGRVVRLYRNRGPLAERRASSEAAALEAARRAGIPVPRNHAVGSYDGAPVFVQDLVPGVTLLDAVKRRPWQLASLGRQFGAMQARIHRLGAVEGIRAIAAADTRLPLDDGPLLDALRAEGRTDTFCHLDYHPLNVLALPGRISAVLDWSNAAITDRRADLAFTETALLRIPAPPSPLNPVLSRARVLLHRAWRAGYQAEAGEFPLTPLFQAASVALFLTDLRESVADGRGWATPDHVAHLEAERDRLARAAGVGD